MDNQISGDLIRGHIDTIILHALNGRDLFPQQISDAVESKSLGEYKINQATLYSSLKRLESLNLVESYWHDLNGEGRRKFYKITDSGMETLNKNLSSWEYSKSVIDKLTDSKPSEKIVVITSAQSTEYKEKPNETIVVVENKPVDIAKEQSTPKTDETEKETNFRNILNGLIKYSESTVKPEETEKTAKELKPLDVIETDDGKVPDFNETVSQTQYNASKINYNGKIDFGDLMIKAANEGYKISVSSKDSAKNKGGILINKLNLLSVCSVFLIAVLEFLLVYLISPAAFENATTVAVTLVCIVPVLFFAVLYFISKNKSISRAIMSDTIITALIVAFNLILLTLVLNFIFGTDFHESAQLVPYFIIPLFYVADIVLFFAIRYRLSKTKTVKTV